EIGAEPAVEEFMSNQMLVNRSERLFSRAIARHNTRSRAGRTRCPLKKIDANSSVVRVPAVPFVQRDDRSRNLQDFCRAVVPGSELRHFVDNLAVLLSAPFGWFADQNGRIVHLVGRSRDRSSLLTLADSTPTGRYAHALGRY